MPLSIRLLAGSIPLCPIRLFYHLWVILCPQEVQNGKSDLVIRREQKSNEAV